MKASKSPNSARLIRATTDAPEKNPLPSPSYLAPTPLPRLRLLSAREESRVRATELVTLTALQAIIDQFPVDRAKIVATLHEEAEGLYLDDTKHLFKFFAANLQASA
jgi:hypothetical protein